MENIIYQAAALLVSLGAFLLGKYVFPNVPKTVTAKLRELAAWADKFVVWAREFRKQDSGPDKMEMVVQQLQAVANGTLPAAASGNPTAIRRKCTLTIVEEREKYNMPVPQRGSSFSLSQNHLLSLLSKPVQLRPPAPSVRTGRAFKIWKSKQKERRFQRP